MTGKSAIQAVADYLGLSTVEVMQAAKRAPTSYKRYSIPKKRGGRRIVFQPSRHTKALQYSLIDLLFSKLPIHASAAAYVKGRPSPLRSNARTHARFSYTVRVDVKDFFPSIQPSDLMYYLRKLPMAPGIVLDSDDASFLSDCCFIAIPGASSRGLAIGAPSSPVISNVVMFDIDTLLHDYANSVGGLCTRYADDFVFSANKKKACAAFVKKIESVFRRTKHPALQLNTTKTVFMSRGTKRLVTGLIATPDGQASVGRHNKRYIRKLLHEVVLGKISEEKKRYLQGYLAFVLDVEPDFFNRLALKYGAELLTGVVHYRWGPRLLPRQNLAG